jgi:hypothetical protein
MHRDTHSITMSTKSSLAVADKFKSLTAMALYKESTPRWTNVMSCSLTWWRHDSVRCVGLERTVLQRVYFNLHINCSATPADLARATSTVATSVANRDDTNMGNTISNNRCCTFDTTLPSTAAKLCHHQHAVRQTSSTLFGT